MSVREWGEIIELVGSTKIKERSDGVSRFRAFLSVTRNFNRINREQSHSWLTTLQALFHLVITERNISVSKPTAAVEKRLEEATNLVRWTVEKVHVELSRKAIKAVLKHLIQMAAYGGKLQSFALTYLKCLRALLQYAPHLEHLDIPTWTDIVSLCFAGTLGDNIKVGKEFADDEAMELDDDFVGVRGSLRHTDEDDVDSATRRTATQEDIELVGCIEAAFRSKSAPFHTYSKIIFIKFSRFFRQFPHETTAHLPALTALNRAFAELDLNDQKTMREVGTQLWPHILGLWASKNTGLKEQVVMALKYLLPFISHLHTNDAILTLIEAKIQPLLDAVMSEPIMRWREGYELDVDNLRLGLDEGKMSTRTTVSQPFSYSTMRHGHEFSAKHAVAWAVLELGAESLAKLHMLSEAARSGRTPEVPQTPEGSNRNKRIKHSESPLAEFIDALRFNEPTPIIIFRLKILLFLVEKHWSRVHLDLCQRLLRTVTALLLHDDLQIQSWAFVVVSAVAFFDLPASELADTSASPSKRDRRTKLTPHWDQVWGIAMRRISNPIVCRVACHTANLLVSQERVSASLIATSIENFTRDLDIQGPHFPSDAVCTFFEWTLACTSSDLRLSRLHLPEKILAWLSTAWKPLDGIVRVHSIGQARPKADPLDPAGLASLVARLCGLENTPMSAHEFLIPDSPIATMAIDICETENIRKYIDNADIAQYVGSGSMGMSKEERGKESTALGNGRGYPKGLDRRILAWLEKMLNGLQGNAEDSADAEAYWSNLGVDMVRRHLDLAVMVLVVVALFDMHEVKTSSTMTIKAACVIISHFAPMIHLGKWQPGERATLLGGLAPLLIPLEPYPLVEYPVLLEPGPASDIPSYLTPVVEAEKDEKFDFSSPHFALLWAIWAREPIRDVLENITESLRVILGGFVEIPPLPTPTPGTQSSASQRNRNEDDFGEIKVAKSLATTRSPQLLSSERAESSCNATCIRGLISFTMASVKSPKAVRVQEIVQAMIEADGDDAIVIAEHAFNAVRVGILDLSLTMAESILEHLGGVLLPAYRYARDERFALAALQFLECTKSLWMDPEETKAEDFATNARHLIAWFTGALARDNLYAWRVRVRLTAFLEGYLIKDPSQTKWDPGCVGTRTTTGESILPIVFLPARLNDADFRVRFRAASSVPRLFTVQFINGLDPQELYGTIKSKLTSKVASNVEMVETMLTNLVCYANIVVTSGQYRRFAWLMMVQIVSMNFILAQQVDSLLDGVATRLGIEGGRRGLFMEYRTYLATQVQSRLELAPSQGDWSKMSYKPCGFSSLLEMRKVDFRECGSVFLAAGNDDSFSSLVHLLNRSQEECVLECLPLTLSGIILKSSDTVDSLKAIGPRLLEFARRAGATDDDNAKRLIQSVAGEVLSHLFAAVWEMVWSAAPREKTDRLSRVQKIVAVSEDLNFAQPASPSFSYDRVSASLSFFIRKFGGFHDSASVYFVIHELLARIRQNPFVDSTQCGLMSLALALATANDHAQDAITLGGVAESLIPLVVRSELVTVVSSILQWVFNQWHDLLNTSPESLDDLCENLVKAAISCETLLQRVKTEPAFAEDPAYRVAYHLTHFLSESLNRLGGHSEGTVRVATLLWPRALVESATISPGDLQLALKSRFKPSSPFRLVSLLQERPELAGAEDSATLWRLLDSLAPDSQPSIDESETLAASIYGAGGQISSPSLEERETSSSKGIGPVIKDEAGIKREIVRDLLEVLHEDNPDTVQLAFKTLRALLSIARPTDLIDQSLSPRSFGAATHISGLPRLRGERARTSRHLTDLHSELWVTLGSTYGLWIPQLAELFADYRAAGEPFYAQLVPILLNSPAVAGTILPRLIHSILLEEIKRDSEIANQTSLSSYFAEVLRDPHTNPRTLTAIVHLAVELRRHPKPSHPVLLDSWDSWLKVPWNLLASGAVRSGQPFAALLFLELGHEYDDLFQVDEAGQPVNRKLDTAAQLLLYDIYEVIDEPDGFYGRESADVQEALARRYRHEGRWNDALGNYGADYENPSTTFGKLSSSKSTAGVVQSLAHSGFNRLAMSLLQPAQVEGLVSERDIPNGLSYDLGWRTDTWDIPVERREAQTSSVAVYKALRAVHTARDDNDLPSLVDLLLIEETCKLSSVNLNSPTPDDSAVSAILALREIRLWADLHIGESLDASIAVRLPMVSSSFKFEHAERILSTRISLLRSIRRAEEAEQVGNLSSDLRGQVSRAETACLLRLSSSARAVGKLQASLNAVTLAHKLCDGMEGTDEVREELANVLWDQGEHTSAISLLKMVSVPSERKALRLARLGGWTSEARLQSAQETLDVYFNPALHALASNPSSSDVGRVHAAFAAFADSQYETSLKVSDELRSRVDQYAARKQTEFVEIDRQIDAAQANSSKDGTLISQLAKVRENGEINLREDRRLAEAALNMTNLMLKTSLEQYGQALLVGDQHDDLVFRFVSLWLGNANDNTIQAGLVQLLVDIKSAKFVFLSHQLSARLSHRSATESPFNKNLRHLVIRITQDHPFQSLYPVQALRVAVTPPVAQSRSRRSSTAPATQTDAGSQSARSLAADDIFAKAKRKPEIKTRVEQFELACGAYQEWAAHSLKQDENYSTGKTPDPRSRKVKPGRLLIRSTFAITKLLDLSIPVSTFDLPIDSSTKYAEGSYPSIHKYEDTFKAAGGLHTPKICHCIGNDGHRYQQLFKGEDDIRQDAVMEQAFVLINKLLARDDRARSRNLFLRTYKVIPLQNQTGVIEFVANTIALAEAIQPLYSKFCKTMSVSEARSKLSACETRKANTPDWQARKVIVFKEILEKMPPVMRHFAFQNQRNPSLWFEMRLNYARSVATTSIVGHIVGLGDRHVNNILMDTARGDLVTIDLGIAFDQGKRLPTPETVPFRLTQNIVDGLGMNGVDGVFRRCAEETLRVLRERSSVVMTVLEVFKHDPLQNWAVSVEMAQKVQGSPDGDVSGLDTLNDLPDDADRALSIVRGKLDKSLSVEYTVNQLIQEATSPENLALIFCGWQPYL
ncbi:serine-protein kinase ATM, partial [Phenoliferia sp. Uapishka_3]